jgi:hypothetical protein
MTWAEVSERVGTVWPGPQRVPVLPEESLVCESVTSILATLHKTGLEVWKMRNVARTAYRRTATTQTLAEEEAVAFLTSSKNWAQEHELSDAACGTEVHKALEVLVLGGDRAVHPEAQPFVRQFDAWRKTVGPEFEAVECTVFDPEYLYAGTLDAVATLADGRRYLLDYKTSRNETNRGPFPEWALQLAAYRWAPLVCPFRVYVPESENNTRSARRYYINKAELAYAVPTPEVDGAAIVHLTPSGWRMYPVRVDEGVRDAFLYVRGAQQFVEVIARRSVFGAYLEGTA